MNEFQIKIQNKDRVQEAKLRMRAFYEGRYMDYIPMCFQLPTPAPYSMGDAQRDQDKAVANAIYVINAQFEQFPDTDYIPWFIPYHLGQGLIPSMFGAVQVIDEDNPPFTQGRLLSGLEEGLSGLKRRVDVEHDGWGPKLKEVVLKFLDATHGDIPVTVCDHQSPYGLATKLVPNEVLMMAMYDTPELVHELLDICATAIDDVIQTMMGWVGHNKELLILNNTTLIPDTGLILWDDYISVISPRQHKEFCYPYNMRLYAKYGKGHLHTCGPYFPGYIDAVLAHEPNSIDLGILRGMGRSREDMLAMHDLCVSHGIGMVCELITAPSIFEKDQWVLPDQAFVQEMAQGGRLFWKVASSRDVELGKQCMSMARSLKL